MTRASDILNAMYSKTPLIFGHRGAPTYAPANTVPAFLLAVEHKAHGIELDVHRSKDGYPVIIHDFTVDRTSNGTGHVTDMTLSELKALDAGSWFDPQFVGTRIPTLDEVFDAVGQDLFINVEIKSMTEETDGVEQVVADCILRHQMSERVFVSSFNPHALRRFREILPDVPLGFLFGEDSPDFVYKLMEGCPVEAIHPQDHLVTAEMVEKAHKQGQRINVWTVNDVQRAKTLNDLGVDCIITDVPDILLKILE